MSETNDGKNGGLVNSTYVQKFTQLDAPSILVNVATCSAKSKRKPLRVVVTLGLAFRLRLGLLFMSSLRRRVRKTLYDLYCPHFSPEVMATFTRKATGQFMTLIESGMHLIMCISGLIEIKT